MIADGSMTFEDVPFAIGVASVGAVAPGTSCWTDLAPVLARNVTSSLEIVMPLLSYVVFVSVAPDNKELAPELITHEFELPNQ